MPSKRFYLFLILTLMLTLCIIEFRHSRDFALNVSAVRTSESLEVYWDKACAKKVYSINWGVLLLGETKEVTVYVRNEGNESIFLVLGSCNWNPLNASDYLKFSWSCEEYKIEVGHVAKVKQTLFVSPLTKGISSFSFDIVFVGKNYLVGDVNKDGVVDMRDIGIISSAFLLTN